jgi:hypothetical protein
MVWRLFLRLGLDTANKVWFGDCSEGWIWRLFRRLDLEIVPKVGFGECK